MLRGQRPERAAPLRVLSDRVPVSSSLVDRLVDRRKIGVRIELSARHVDDDAAIYENDRVLAGVRGVRARMGVKGAAAVAP
jgi:hypothetical protein